MALLKSILWNEQERRLRVGWRLLIYLLLMIINMGSVMLVVIGAAVLDQRSLPPALMGTISFFVLTALATWLAARLLDRRPLADFGFHFSRCWWLDFAFGLALGAVLMTAIFLIELAAGWLRVTGTLQVEEPGRPFAAALLIPLAGFIAIGFAEEIGFRGYLLRNLAEAFNLPTLGSRAALLLAWLGSSTLFGIAHAYNPNASLVSTLFLILAGLLLGLGLILTGELAIPIGIHISWNFFQGHVFGFAVSGTRTSQTSVLAVEQLGPLAWTGGPFGPEAGLVGLLAMLAGTLLIMLWVRARDAGMPLALHLTQPPPPATAADRSPGAPSAG